MGQVGWHGVQDCAVSTQHPSHRYVYCGLLSFFFFSSSSSFSSPSSSSSSTSSSLCSACLYFTRSCLPLTPFLSFFLLPFLSFPFSPLFYHSFLHFIPNIFSFLSFPFLSLTFFTKLFYVNIILSLIKSTFNNDKYHSQNYILFFISYIFIFRLSHWVSVTGL